MRTVKTIPSLLALSLLAAGGPTLAADGSAGVPGEWLSRWTGARTTGLGGAFVATADEALGVVWNPAGLTRLNQNEIHFETARLFEDTSVNGFSLARPASGFPSIGFTALSLRTGDFEKTNDLNEPLGSFREGDLAALFTVAQAVGQRITLGTNVKIVRQSIDEFQATGWGADIGAMWAVTPKFRLGFSFLNALAPSLQLRDTSESYAREVRGGMSTTFLDGRGLVTLELAHMDGPGVRMRGGTEYWIHRTAALRVGYDESSPTAGMSYRVKPDMRLDYGLTSHELGVTHRFGVSYRFGGYHARAEANPSAFSPLGDRPVTKIEMKAQTKAATKSWKLSILDKQNDSVREFGGPGAPPAHLMWDGKNTAGLPLPDGIYTYHLTVVDDQGRHLESHPHAVEITTGGVQGSVPVMVN